MGTPEDKDKHAATYDFAGLEIQKYLLERLTPESTILDVGAGWGKYKFLFPNHTVDAIEVWEPYVEKNNLRSLYRTVYLRNVTEFVTLHNYDAVIFGDVLEHLSVEDAQKAISKFCTESEYVIVAVPFQMPQGEEEGNCHEIHIQDDLNLQLMEERYPELELLTRISVEGVQNKAIYIKKAIK